MRKPIATSTFPGVAGRQLANYLALLGLVVAIAGCGGPAPQATTRAKSSSEVTVSPLQPPARAATVSTQVISEATGLPPTGSETAGTAFHDTATVVVTKLGSPFPSGWVTYDFFLNADCSGTSNAVQKAAISAGVVPNSASSGPLLAGAYSYQATYSGDVNYAGSTSSCEPVKVNRLSAPTATQVISEATGLPPTGNEMAGSAFHDTATVVVTKLGSPFPTGKVTYGFFPDGSCSNAKWAQTVLIAGGVVPNSNSTGALVAGSYSFRADYGGDGSYSASSSECEPFAVKGASPPTTATQVITDSTGLPPTGNEVAGAAFHDTATIFITALGSPFPTGTVTYAFFTNGFCRGVAASTKTVTIAGGVVPNSASTGPLVAGSYSYQATYSGDANHAGSSSDCEAITVKP